MLWLPTSLSISDVLHCEFLSALSSSAQLHNLLLTALRESVLMGIYCLFGFGFFHSFKKNFIILASAFSLDISKVDCDL